MNTTDEKATTVVVDWGDGFDHSSTVHEFSTEAEAAAFVVGIDCSVGFMNARVITDHILNVELREVGEFLIETPEEVAARARAVTLKRQVETMAELVSLF